jgi:hypothetical protein
LLPGGKRRAQANPHWNFLQRKMVRGFFRAAGIPASRSAVMPDATTPQKVFFLPAPAKWPPPNKAGTFLISKKKVLWLVNESGRLG